MSEVLVEAHSKKPLALRPCRDRSAILPIARATFPVSTMTTRSAQYHPPWFAPTPARRNLYCSTLSPHHLVNPDRRKRRRAAFGNRIVAIETDFFSDRDSPLAMLGKVNSDSRKTEIHCPLCWRSSVPHFGFDAIE